ncbi:MAG TPA: T9SS type A sorting domain-containing protein [Lacibacter sp.]|nr:T9SS type A sorting domain-containing protein [Lacibacter sp.]HMO89173.1 T9SS type A sorting domain-containing protein [Lacibacter sp.]
MLRPFFRFTLFVILLFAFTQCNQPVSDPHADAPVLIFNEEEHDDDDEWTGGAYESLMMDYELTKDPKLGYVPAERLVLAYDKILKERRSGRYARLASALNWQERGPTTNTVGPSNGNVRGPQNNAVTSGRKRAIWLDLNDPTHKTVWVGSVSGGLWKTNNITADPANWILVNDFLGNLAVTSITQDPVNKNVLYFGTGERNGNVDAVRGGGVWKSTDNGVTWNLLPNTVSFWNISKIACDGAGNLYVGTSGNAQGLQRSTDGGATWTNITPATTGNGTRISELKISSNGRLHVTMGANGSAANQSGYFYTDNPATVTSATWTAPVSPFLPNNQVQFNCELAVVGNVLYALPANSSNLTPQIFRSLDGGANWTATGSSPPGNSASEPTINSGQGWFNLAIGIDPNNTNNVIAGGLNFYSSSDGGQSWTQLTRWVGSSIMYVHADHHNVVWSENGQVLLATDGGIFYSGNNAASFVDRNVGLRTKQFYSCAIHPTTTNYFIGGTQDNGTHQLTSPGLAGSVEVLGGDGGFTHIDEDEPQFQYSATVFSQYRRSVNGGSSWSSVNFSSSVGQFINPTDYDDINNIMYCAAGGGSYVRWNNPQNGASFTTVSISSATFSTVRSIKVSPHTPNRVYFGTSDGNVVRVNQAHTTTPQASSIRGSSMPTAVLSCINTGTSDNNLIASFSSYGVPHVWVSTTGGGAGGWVNIDGNLPDIPVRWAMFHPEINTRAIVATDMGVFETENINGSATIWVQNSTFPNVRTNMFQYRVSDRTLLAATHGRGMFTATIPAAAPYVRFASSYSYSRPFGEQADGSDGCRRFRDIPVKMLIDAAPSGAANVTLSVTPGGTATEGIDFDFTTNGSFTSPSKVVTFPGGSSASQDILVRIYDDAEQEETETFTLSFNVGGSTNAVAAPGGSSYTITITDNDTDPVPPSNGVVTVGNTSYGQYIQPFRGSNAKSRSQYIYTAAELTAAGVVPGPISSIGFNVTAKASSQPYSGFRIALKHTSASVLSTGSGFEPGATLVFFGSHTTTVGINNFTFNQSNFNWDGTSNLLVEICYNNISNNADDNVASNTTTDIKGLWNRVSSTDPQDGCSLPGQFTNVSGAFVRPDLYVGTQVGNGIETTLNRERTEFVGGSGVYYYSAVGTNNVLGRISNAASPIGCTNLRITESGTAWANYFAGQRSSKVVAVTPSTNLSANYQVGIYLKTDELGGRTPSAVNLAFTTAASAGAATWGNTVILPTNFTPFADGYLFFGTNNVSGAGRVFATDAFITSINDLRNRGSQFVRLMQNPVAANINLDVVNENRRNIQVSLYTVSGAALKQWNLGRATGTVSLSLSGLQLSGGSYLLRVEDGEQVRTFKVIKQ